MAKGFGYMGCIPAVQRGSGEPEYCPACGQRAYLFSEGEHDHEQQLTPAEGHCWLCGFDYSEHCQHPQDEQVAGFIADKFPEVMVAAVQNHRRVRRLERLIVGLRRDREIDLSATKASAALMDEADRILKRRARERKRA